MLTWPSLFPAEKESTKDRKIRARIERTEDDGFMVGC
jgi:hypothetical protein